MSRKPEELDRHIGLRLRLKRTLLNMTQEDLASQLGITFQQIQKYEKGTNRISASRLHHIRKILDVPLEYFYEGFQKKNDYQISENIDKNKNDYISSLPNQAKDTLETDILQQVSNLSDIKIKKEILDNIKNILDKYNIAHI